MTSLPVFKSCPGNRASGRYEGSTSRKVFCIDTSVVESQVDLRQTGRCNERSNWTGDRRRGQHENKQNGRLGALKNHWPGETERVLSV
jgi:hypothetical protein